MERENAEIINMSTSSRPHYTSTRSTQCRAILITVPVHSRPNYYSSAVDMDQQLSASWLWLIMGVNLQCIIWEVGTDIRLQLPREKIAKM